MWDQVTKLIGFTTTDASKSSDEFSGDIPAQNICDQNPKLGRRELQQKKTRSMLFKFYIFPEYLRSLPNKTTID